MYKNGCEGGQGDNVHFFMKATKVCTYVQEMIAMVDVTIRSHSLLIRNTFICKKKTNYPQGITADGWLKHRPHIDGDIIFRK